MPDIHPRLIPTLLLASAAATLAAAAALAPAGGLQASYQLLTMAGAAGLLALAVPQPSLRPLALAVALTTKAGFVGAWLLAGAAEGENSPLFVTEVLLLAVLAAVAALEVHAHRLEARWDGVLPSRQEG
jgi:hypothetical protein